MPAAATAAAPATAAIVSGFVQVSVGRAQACALRRDGGIVCWGSSLGGLLRPPAGAFLQISVSPVGHACAITVSGALRCWGSLYGPGGGEGVVNGTFLQVAAGDSVTCAVRSDGTLLCFGERRRLWAGRAAVGAGAAGNTALSSPGGPPEDTTFAEVSIASRGLAACGVAQGGRHGDEGRVLCWGEHAGVAAVPQDLEPAIAAPLTIDF